MKIYKKMIAIVLSSSLLVLSGCSPLEKKEDLSYKQVEQLENEVKELKEEIRDLQEKQEDVVSVDEEVKSELEKSDLQIIQPEQEIKTEEDLVAYFSDMEEKVNISSSEDDSKKKKTIQNMVATFLLFLNDEATINGYTFHNLSDTTKEKIKSIFSRMDQKINQKIPGYSEPIIKSFSFAKEKVKSGKEIVNNSFNEAFGEEVMEDTKQNFKNEYEDMKDSFRYWKEKVLEKAKKEIQ